MNIGKCIIDDFTGFYWNDFSICPVIDFVKYEQVYCVVKDMQYAAGNEVEDVYDVEKEIEERIKL